MKKIIIKKINKQTLTGWVLGVPMGPAPSFLRGSKSCRPAEECLSCASVYKKMVMITIT